MTDPIVEDLHRIRDAHAARFDHDLDAIFRDIKERERASGLVFVNGVARAASTVESRAEQTLDLPPFVDAPTPTK